VEVDAEESENKLSGHEDEQHFVAQPRNDPYWVSLEQQKRHLESGSLAF